MNEDLTVPQGLDPRAVNLSRAIRFRESKGNYNAIGDAGTSHGAYQWQPDTWKAHAKEAGLDPNDFSPKNQDMVAYKVIKNRIDQGYGIPEVAAEWNSGNKNNWQNHSGDTVINGQKIHYDTPAYAQAVNNYYQKIKGGTNQPENDLTKDTVVQPIQQTKPDQHTTEPGTVISNVGKGRVGDAIQSGIRNVGSALTFGGTEQLGDEVGKSLAYFKEKGKGLLGGQDNSKYIPKPDFGKLSAGAAKTVGGALLTAGIGGKIAGALTKTDVLTSPAVRTAIKMNPAKFAALSSADKVNRLTGALADASVVDRVVIQQAIDKIIPLAIKEAGGKVAFAELYPKVAKLLGLAGKGVKYGGGLYLLNQATKDAKGLLEGLTKH